MHTYGPEHENVLCMAAVQKPPLNPYAEVSSGQSLGLNFGLHLPPYFLYLRNKGSEETLGKVIKSHGLAHVFTATVKPVLSSHSKIEKKKVLKTCGSLVQVRSIAECSCGAFCNTLDLH